MNHKITFVTCFYACTPDTDVNAYFRTSMRTLAAPVPLVIYCEQKHEYLFLGLRVLCGLGHLTKMKTIPLTELFFYQFKDKVDSNRRAFWPTRDARTNSTNHLIMLSKFQFMKETMETNPFQTNHVGWIDINLFSKTCNNSLNYIKSDIYDMLQKISYNPKPKFSIQILNCWKREDYSDLKKFYSSYKWIVAGCFWTTDLETGKDIIEKLISKSIEITNLGFGHADEMIYAPIIDENFYSFNLSIGDYQDTIHNYYKPAININYINKIIYTHLMRGHKERIERIMKAWNTQPRA